MRCRRRTPVSDVTKFADAFKVYKVLEDGRSHEVTV